MTEQEWLECNDPASMLEFLQGRGYERKARLFAVACCRRIWHLFVHDASRHAVDVGERQADGQMSEDELSLAHQCASDICQLLGDALLNKALLERNQLSNAAPAVGKVHPYAAAEAAESAIAAVADFHADFYYKEKVWSAFLSAARAVAWAKGTEDTPDTDAEIEERATQAMLFRDIFGNPLRPAAVLPTWQTANVVSIAQAIYDERAFDRLPILADALEDGGCMNADILNHCRQPGEHVRGCWVVDLLLAKK